jgi:hypothetical protein
MDFNSSMRKHLDSLKDQIVNIVKDVQRTSPTTVIELAVVGYAGVSDWPRDRYQVFTGDIDTLHQALLQTTVSNSLDAGCRYVVEGYQKTNTLDWTANRKIMIHMGNAPSYGKNYHGNDVYDMFPSGHPYWTLEEEIQSIASKQIDVVILKLSKTTTLMEKLLDANYRKYRKNGFYVVDCTQKLHTLDAAIYAEVKQHLLRSLA